MSDSAQALWFRLLRFRESVWVGFALGLALLCGALAVRSPQLAITLALLILLYAVRGQSRTAALFMLWIYWLLVPGLRRVLDLSIPTPGADPLSLFPFLATALLALVELREIKLDRRARSVLSLAATGFLIGLPVGLVVEPAAATFVALAYCSGLAGFVLGWSDEIAMRGGSTLRRTLSVALPLLALYAIAQYIWPLTAWDQHWVDTAGLRSIGAPEEGHIRVFSTLNSYFTFAIVLATGILLALGERRRTFLGALAFAPMVLALVFTYNRSAWLGLVAGLLVFAIAGRRQAAGRVVIVALLCFAALIFVGNSNPTTRAFTQRVTSLGSPGKDVSTQERLKTTERLLPEAIGKPVGAGLGQAGIASERLGESEESTLANVDDGYLSLMYQAGPFGLLLVLTGIGICLSAATTALNNAAARDLPARAALLATIVMLIVLLATGEVLFGLPGVIFWYLCGVAVATRRRLVAMAVPPGPRDRTGAERWPERLVQSSATSGQTPTQRSTLATRTRNQGL